MNTFQTPPRVNRRGFFGLVLVAPLAMLGRRSEPPLVAVDCETGISIRFVQSFDSSRALAFHPEAFAFVWPDQSDRICSVTRVIAD